MLRFDLAVPSAAVAGHTIGTGRAGLVAGEVTIAAGDSTLELDGAMAQGDGPFPVVLGVFEICGVHEPSADVATLLATAVSKVPDAQGMADRDACVARANDQRGATGRRGIGRTSTRSRSKTVGAAALAGCAPTVSHDAGSISRRMTPIRARVA
jgi:hypothetical protein